MPTEKKTFDDLVAIMARLRADDGCPWDREQTLETLKPYLIEEAYEVLEAIEAGEPAQHCEELGDVLLQIAFQSQLAAEKGDFDAADVTDAICRKLLRRHPHVFGHEQAETAADVITHWERIKKNEKQAKPGADGAQASILDGVPRSLPALLAAHKLSERAARVGFDWPQIDGVLDKVEEELEEIKQAAELTEGTERQRQLEWEVGDLLFAVVNLARHLGLSAEDALRQANQRFRARFGHLERQAARTGLDLNSADLDQLESLWSQAKREVDPS